MKITVGLAKDFITPIQVKPCHTLVLLTTEEALVLLPDGSWTRTPLKGPQDLAAKVAAAAATTAAHADADVAWAAARQKQAAAFRQLVTTGTLPT